MSLLVSWPAAVAVVPGGAAGCRAGCGGSV